uniref:Uncharacterized protein n=1 Tax=uncultured marine virus TaxID=186617 RepID=A0A0F7L537_9VIRU|nr:hypothetical protein [uncultured marine virus]
MRSGAANDWATRLQVKKTGSLSRRAEIRLWVDILSQILGNTGTRELLLGKMIKEFLLQTVTEKTVDSFGKTIFFRLSLLNIKVLLGTVAGQKHLQNKKKLTREEIRTKFRAARTPEEQKAILQTLKDDYGIKTAEEARVFVGGR